MSLILGLGSNIGNCLENLKEARDRIHQLYPILATSNVYYSKAVEYKDQPDFFNQVIECSLPQSSPAQTIKKLLEIEQSMGRDRSVPKGPRNIDIDLLFFAQEVCHSPECEVPHPRLFERSFVVLPLKELPYFKILEKSFRFPASFSNSAAIYPTRPLF